MYAISEIFLQCSRPTYPYTKDSELPNPSINVLNVICIHKYEDFGFDSRVVPTYTIEFEMIGRNIKRWHYPQTPEGLKERDSEYEKITRNA